MKLNQSRKFGILLTLTTLVVSAALVYSSFRGLAASRDDEVSQAEVHTQNLAQAIDLSISGRIGHIDQALVTLVSEIERSLATGRLEPGRLQHIVEVQQHLLPEAVAFYISRSDGTLILGNPTADRAANFRDRPFWAPLRDHPEAGLVITEATQSLFTKQWMIYFARRYRLPDGRFGGVVLAPVLVEHLQKTLAGFNVGKGGRLTLRDAGSGFVARHPVVVKGKTQAVGNREIATELEAVLATGVRQKTYSAVTPYDQTKRVFTFRWLSVGPLYVVASLAEEDFLAQWQAERRRTLIWLGITILGSWGMAATLWLFWLGRERDGEALLASRKQYRSLVENTPDLVTRVDEKGRMVFVNHAALTHYGLTPEACVGRMAFDFVAPEDRESTIAAFQAWLKSDREVFEYENRLVGVDGQSHHMAWLILAEHDGEGRVVGFASTARDITERKRLAEEKLELQSQLQQSQKMESLGTLAGGVAHDMNNVLGAILGLASAHIGSLPAGSPLHRALGTICKATERGGQMVKSLLSFARQSVGAFSTLDVNAILRDESTLLERTTLSKVHTQMELEPNLHPILGDASALTHAIMNLCVNAVDAMPEHGRLTLRTRNVDEDWIEVVVEDNGMGMPKDVMEKALDPFFTTKEPGKGTGLGLSMVYSIIKAHRGQLLIQSEPGRGTRVRMRFPACRNEPVVPGSAEPADLPPAHTVLEILVVDDDELIQGSLQAVLDVMGHTVHPALSGEEALAKLQKGLVPDLIILDMNMPGLGGVGTLPRLRGLNPRVPVLLSTGRADETALSLAAAFPGVTLLPKPFGLRELRNHFESIGLA